MNVVNMSLGGEFSPQDDPEAYAVDALTRAGVLSVISAGNANDYSLRGDTYSNSGHPATAASAITVANAYGSPPRRRCGRADRPRHRHHPQGTRRLQRLLPLGTGGHQGIHR